MKNIGKLLYPALAILVSIAISCARQVEKQPAPPDGRDFLEASFQKGADKETFRVLITSDRYAVVQTDHQGTIQREQDPGGDKYICDEIKKYDKIDETRDGMYHVSLFPDRGTLMKVRPYKPLNLIELDNAILDDLQRWTFKFPGKVIQPNTFFIRYRIILRKRQTDEQILKELQKKMLGEEE